MERGSKLERTYIEYFNPDVVTLSNIHQDFPFTAGVGYENFDDFVNDEAEDYASSGDGVTHLVFNVFYDDIGNEMSRELVLYYTLAATAIPYIDRIRLDEDEAKETGKEYDEQLCGIPALEIKMFKSNGFSFGV